VRPVSLDLQLQEQMKLTKLECPSIVTCELLHPTKIVDDKSTNSPPRAAWNRPYGSFPLVSALLAFQKQRVEENGSIPAASF
jgi:hypothetical protein